MPLPEKINWSAISRDVPTVVALALRDMQETIEDCFRVIRTDVLEAFDSDIGTEDRWSGDVVVFYDMQGDLYFYVGGRKVCWFDWSGNWYRSVNFDNLSTDLAGTNDRQLVMYNTANTCLNIYHKTNQVLQITPTEVIIDNQYAFRTGRTLKSSGSNKWIDEDEDSTFISVKGNRVLQIKDTNIDIKGAMKVA